MDEEKKYKILIVDDEQDIIEFLTYNLKRDGYEVASANNGLDAINIAMTFLPQLILLDVMMPEMDGIETCDELKKRPPLKNTIIAFLTARSEDYSQIAGFDAGADDYITKPIKPKVLMSRIKALLKRLEKQTPEKAINPEIESDIKSIIIDKDRYIVVKEGIEMLLPKKEFDLLYLLSSKPNRVFTRNEIFTTVWGDDVVVGDRTIDVHIRKLREKIGEEHFKTIKGVGYKYVE
jgi:two-component system alkaline phosphatase synthesis response regulator PhoP